MTKLIIEQKRKIRKVVNEIPDRRYVRSDWDSYVELIYLPKEITSEEIAEEYFDAYEKGRFIVHMIVQENYLLYGIRYVSSVIVGIAIIV